MTSLLQEAVQKAMALPEEQQNALAAIVLQEIESEQRWQESFRARRAFWTSSLKRRWRKTDWDGPST